MPPEEQPSHSQVIPSGEQRSQQEDEQGSDFCLDYIRSVPDLANADFADFERIVKESSAEKAGGVVRLASFLIDHGYPRPIQLYRSLHESEAKKKLYFQLLEKGIIAINSSDATNAQRFIEQEVESSEDIRDLILSGMPVEVVGQVMTVDRFDTITDEKKMEELRSWTTVSLLRPFLGTLEGRRPEKQDELSIPDVAKRIPKKIFTNAYAAKYNLVENYFLSRFMRLITTKGESAGFRAVEDAILDSSEDGDEDKFAFFTLILSELQKIQEFQIPEQLNDQIIVKGEERDFPSFEQRAFAYYFNNERTRLLTADTGLGKTAAAFLAMEKSDASRVLVVAPASGQKTWEEQEALLFRHPGDIFLVRSVDDLSNPDISKYKYVVLSQTLLSRPHVYKQLTQALDNLVNPENGIAFDGMIIDEIDNLRNHSNIGTKTTRYLLDKIRTNYAEKTGKEKADAPVMGLTATPIRNDLKDLNTIMAMLYPNEFVATEQEAEMSQEMKTFRGTCLKNPWLAYPKLIGEKRMFRWTGEQEKPYKAITVEVSPFEQLLYDFIGSEFKTDALNRIRILEDSLLNPTLVRPVVRERMLKEEKFKFRDPDVYARYLQQIMRHWKEYRGIEDPQTDEDYLSVDRLVELGFHKFVMETYFHPLFDEKMQGLDFLVEEYGRLPEFAEIAKFWKPKELSSKYTKLRELTKDALTWRTQPDGTVARKKILIVSPGARQGRTGDVKQKYIQMENGASNRISESELTLMNDMTLPHLVEQWGNGLLDAENIIVIDGEAAKVGPQRDHAIHRWVDVPEDAAMVATLESIYQSRDFTINTTEDEQGRTIDGVAVIFLTWPWHWQQFGQTMGRNIRLGMVLPVSNLVLESEGLLDIGKGGTVLYSKELTNLVLSGVTISPELFTKRQEAARIPLKTAEARFLGEAMGYLRGSGEDVLLSFIEEESKITDKNKGELLADKYYDQGNDEYQISGYNADFVSNLIKTLNLEDGKIASIGAGTLLLQRKLHRGIDNIDINPYMMQAGWSEAEKYGGKTVVGRASYLDPAAFPGNTYDVVDNAFSLHWSKLKKKGNGDVSSAESERAHIITEMHRILKKGGVLSLTLPEGAFDDGKFVHFLQVLENHFGFKVDEQHTGKTFGISEYGMRKRLGWCIVAKKDNEVTLNGLTPEDLAFHYDRETWTSNAPQLDISPSLSGQTVFPVPAFKLEFDEYEIQPLSSRRRSIIEKQESTFPRNNGQAKEPLEEIEEATLYPEENIFPNETTDELVDKNAGLKEYFNVEYLRGRGNKRDPRDREIYQRFRGGVLRVLERQYGIRLHEGEAFAVNALHEWIDSGRSLPRSQAEAYKIILNMARKKQKDGILEAFVQGSEKYD